MWKTTVLTLLKQYQPSRVLDTSCDFARLCALNEYVWQSGASVKAFRSRRELEHIRELRRRGKTVKTPPPAPGLDFEPFNLCSRDIREMVHCGYSFDFVFVDAVPCSADLFPLVEESGKMVVLQPVVRVQHPGLLESNNLFDVYQKRET